MMLRTISGLFDAQRAARVLGRRLRLRTDHEETIYLFLRNPLTIAGVLCISVWVLVMAVAPWLAPFPRDGVAATHVELRLLSPRPSHWLGTDYLGRDILSRIFYGSRITVPGGIIPIGIAMAIGTPVGAVAGFFGGRLETTLMRIADVFLALPGLVLAIVVTSVLGPKLFNVMLALSIVWWPWYARLTHAQALSLKSELFIEAARGLGAPRLFSVVRHILPNSAPVVLVKGTTDLGFGILTMAGLGFLGMGAQPPSPEWGLDVSVARSYLWPYWWTGVFPGLAIFSVVLAFNFIGDGLRDAIDPRMRGR
jgi:peptide/nickel transport system permease protein